MWPGSRFGRRTNDQPWVDARQRFGGGACDVERVASRDRQQRRRRLATTELAEGGCGRLTNGRNTVFEGAHQRVAGRASAQAAERAGSGYPYRCGTIAELFADAWGVARGAE